jgi:hypothetical protein
MAHKMIVTKNPKSNTVIVRVGSLEVHVIQNDDGVVADIWPVKDTSSAEACIASAWALFNEAEDEDN